MRNKSAWYREHVAQHDLELAAEQPFALKGDSKNVRGAIRRGLPTADARYLDWLTEQGRAPKGRLL
jgi:hypothetical protein